MEKRSSPDLWRLPLLPSAQALCWIIDVMVSFFIYLKSMDHSAFFDASQGCWKRAAQQGAFTSWATYIVGKYLHLWRM